MKSAFRERNLTSTVTPSHDLFCCFPLKTLSFRNERRFGDKENKKESDKKKEKQDPNFGSV